MGGFFDKPDILRVGSDEEQQQGAAARDGSVCERYGIGEGVVRGGVEGAPSGALSHGTRGALRSPAATHFVLYP